MSREVLCVCSSNDKLPESKSNSDFQLDFRSAGLQNVRKILVSKITVPNVFYNIRGSYGVVNNSINLLQNGVPVLLPITISEGQYNLTQFTAALKVAIDAKIASTVTITVDPITYKLTFSVAAGNITILQNSTMSEVLGISADLFCNPAGTAQSIYDLQGYSNVFIHSPELGRSHGIDGGFGQISLLAMVSLATTPFGVNAFYQANDSELSEVVYDSVNPINTVTIVLRDSKGNKLPIGTNEMTLVFKCYKLAN